MNSEHDFYLISKTMKYQSTIVHDKVPLYYVILQENMQKD